MASTNIERVVRVSELILTLLKFTNRVGYGEVSAPAVVATETPYEQWVALVNEVNTDFQRLVRSLNTELVDGPVVETAKIEQEIETNRRSHLEAKFGSGALALKYDVWWDPATDLIRYERGSAFVVRWETYLLSIDVLRAFLAEVRRINGP